jgi:zeta-carotene isomerase
MTRQLLALLPLAHGLHALPRLPLAPRPLGPTRSTPLHLAAEPPRPPDLPPPTEEGGPLAWFLPVSLLLESQATDRAAAGDLLVGEDAAMYAWKNEKLGELGRGRDWGQFALAVGSILTALAVLWIYPATGYADDFLAWLEGLAGGNSHLVTLAFGLLFPLVHSGLASLRPYGEKVVGARTWRVIFAWPSLCLAYSWIVYYIAHIHDGIEFWNLQAEPAAHGLAWCINFISFFFLYPTVFNLKEVAAVEKPKVWDQDLLSIPATFANDGGHFFP